VELLKYIDRAGGTDTGDAGAVVGFSPAVHPGTVTLFMDGPDGQGVTGESHAIAKQIV
jgi:hypothetical protein